MGLLCVPSVFTDTLLGEYHQELGHPGLDKLLSQCRRRYTFADHPLAVQRMSHLTKHCRVCQQAKPPNWPLKMPVQQSHIPNTILTSVSMDVFQLPQVEWMGITYNAMVIYIDRHSGWVFALPTQYEGLTAEKLAKMMLHQNWLQFGIPAIITSDQGPQFVGKWFQTVCSTLGIRQAYSQAYRPQANGRAERAGGVVIQMLRRLHLEGASNWVEILPKVISIHNDTPGVMGLSPFQIWFGRERGQGGLPTPNENLSVEAQDFLSRMHVQDQRVQLTLSNVIWNQVQALNAKRKFKGQYKVGDLVWVQRPAKVGGHKLNPYWAGPAKIVSQKGLASFTVLWQGEVHQDVHQAQLKPYLEDAVRGDPTPLTSQGEATPVAAQPLEFTEIVDHDWRENKPYFQATFQGANGVESSWFPASAFIRQSTPKFVEYCREHFLELPILQGWA